MENEMENDDMAEYGRGTDNVMAHLSLGELVVPRAFLDDPQVMQFMQQLFQAAGADINQYTVGHEANSINPETGYPEFKFGKIFKKIASIAIPAALSYFAPGIGSALGSSILGAGAAGSSTLGNALIGAGVGGLTGGGKGALLGAATSGIGANLGSLGSGLQGPTVSGATLDQPSGILGAVRGATGITNSGLSSIGGLLGGSGTSGGGSSFSGLSTLGSALGGLQQDAALKKQREQLLAAQNQQLGNLENLNPTNVQNDPGYQFTQQQGEEALNRSLGAQGKVFSGAALKAASDYNQNLANNFYNQAYQRQAGLVGAQNDIYGNTGNINANATLGRSNNINQTLANALGANVGNYNGGQISNADLLALMKQRGLA